MTVSLLHPSPAPADEEVAAALDALVAEGPLSVAFQPIVDLERGDVLGYEVLGRCAAIDGPLARAAARPDTLLSLAERHGRLLSLDRRWREIAIGSIAEHGDLRSVFFLNVDPRIVDHPSHTPGFTLSLVERHRLAPDRFVLELTEVGARDEAAVDRMLEHYGRQGFRVALDDLGAGQKELLTLLRVQPQIVKLDRELVRSVDVDAARAHLLGALAEFARRAGITLVAEGIETPGELDAVCRAGVGLGQGFLLGRPAPRPEPLSAEARETLRAVLRRAAPRSTRSYGTRDPSLPLIDLVEALSACASLEEMLQHVTDAAATLLGVSRASLRVLDERRERLLVAARTGAPIHGRAGADFAVGEGFAGWVARHRAPLRVDHADLDPRFAPKPGMTAPIGSFLGVPLLDDEGCIGVLATTSTEQKAFSAVDERWLRVVAGAAAPHLAAQRARRLAVTDPLTSALDLRALDDLLPLHSATAGDLPSVLAIDVDRFADVNDRLGRAAGDEVLRALVRTVSHAVRPHDRVVRVGRGAARRAAGRGDLRGVLHRGARARGRRRGGPPPGGADHGLDRGRRARPRGAEGGPARPRGRGALPGEGAREGLRGPARGQGSRGVEAFRTDLTPPAPLSLEQRPALPNEMGEGEGRRRRAPPSPSPYSLGQVQRSSRERGAGGVRSGEKERRPSPRPVHAPHVPWERTGPPDDASPLQGSRAPRPVPGRAGAPRQRARRRHGGEARAVARRRGDVERVPRAHDDPGGKVRSTRSGWPSRSSSRTSPPTSRRRGSRPGSWRSARPWCCAG